MAGERAPSSLAAPEMFGCRVCCADGDGETVIVQAQPGTVTSSPPGLPVTDECHDEDPAAYQALDDEDRQDDFPMPPPEVEAAPVAVGPVTEEMPTQDLAEAKAAAAIDKYVEEAGFPAQDLAEAKAAATIDKYADEAGEYFAFEATIDKTGGEKLCLDISAYDGQTLLVGKVKKGPVERWNTENPQLSIQRGDRITGINGQSGDSDELLSAARADVLKLSVRRLLVFTVKLTHLQGGDALNMEFDDAGDGRCVVRSVADGGLASKANKRNTADLEIRPGDTILQVNDEKVESDPESARVLTSAYGDYVLRLRRPDPADPDAVPQV